MIRTCIKRVEEWSLVSVNQLSILYYTCHTFHRKVCLSRDLHVLLILTTGEANRLIAWIVRHCGQSSVMTTVARAGSVPLLCSMMHGDYAIMQNEALVALTLMAGSCLGQ